MSQSLQESSENSSSALKLEVVVLPVADVDRAKAFYAGLGWRLDADFVNGDAFRVVQFTPPGSNTSVHFGKGLTPAVPGSAQGLYLIVADIEAARVSLKTHGAEVSDAFHRAAVGGPALPGRDPEGRSYNSFATFSDPDGNGWILQEITARLPGASKQTSPHMVRWATWRQRFVGRRKHMASTRSGTAASTISTGRTGMPLTWWRKRPARTCRSETRRLRDRCRR